MTAFQDDITAWVVFQERMEARAALQRLEARGYTSEDIANQLGLSPRHAFFICNKAVELPSGINRDM